MTHRRPLRRHRSDSNEDEVVAALRRCGCSVVSLSQVGGGVPDLLVGYRGRNFLLEVKRPGEALNADQDAWATSWRGATTVVWDVEGALRVVGAL